MDQAYRNKYIALERALEMCAQLFDYCYPIQILIDDFPILSNNYDKFSICDSRIRSGKCNTLLFSTNWAAFRELWLSLKVLNNPLHRYANYPNKKQIIVNWLKQLVMHCRISNYASFISVYHNYCCILLDPIDSVFVPCPYTNHLPKYVLR